MKIFNDKLTFMAACPVYVVPLTPLIWCLCVCQYERILCAESAKRKPTKCCNCNEVKHRIHHSVQSGKTNQNPGN